MDNNVSNTIERVILVGISCDGGADYISRQDAQVSLDELGALAETCGSEIVGRLIQARSGPDNAYYIGKGKIEELKELGEATEADTVIFDDDLTGAHIRNIEEATGLKVIDRTMLILDIFATRAVSNEGKLQVELAQMKYRLPRLIGLGKALSRQGGGIGTRGPGESKLVSDRKHIHRRITALEAKLKQMEKSRELLRKNRQRTGIPTVAIVGYTNAGKSTLMNALCASDCLAENKLFATLDTTTRRYSLPEGREILMIDTVGFIRKLPHNIVEAFKSTLEEAMEADILIHLCDASDPQLDNHIRVVDNLLTELHARDTDPILVFNKCDTLADGEDPIVSYEYRHRRPIMISAVTGQGLKELTDALSDRVNNNTTREWVLIPWAQSGTENWIRENAVVLEAHNVEQGRLLNILVENRFMDRISSIITEVRP
ncbi:MAG: GTPase HflX [Clostridia bacterium]|nr:GTPase HflX [Clostridia bacterium]